MHLHPGAHWPRGERNRRRLRPCLLQLEERAVPSLSGIADVAIDTSLDVYVSYSSTGPFSNQQQSVAEFASNGAPISLDVFSTTGASAFPGALTIVGASASLPTQPGGPSASGSTLLSSDILELQPDGQYFVYDPATGTASRYDSLHAARWTSRDLRARRIQPFLRYGKRSNADCPETRSDRRAQYRKRRDHG